MRNSLLFFALVVLCIRQSMSAQNHLEPCAIRYGEEADYMYWLQETLMKEEDGSRVNGRLDMLFFDTDYCGEEYIAVLIDDSEIEGINCSLFYARADEPLYYVLRDYRKDHRSFGVYPEVKVERVEVEFPSKTARDILLLWREALFSTRYSRTHECVLDGVTYLFTTVDDNGRRLYGETPGQESGDTARLIKIGELLMTYCRASEQKRRDDILAKLKLLIVQEVIDEDVTTNLVEWGGLVQPRQRTLEEIRKQMDETILKQREDHKTPNGKE